MHKLTGTTFLVADRHQPVRAIVRHVLHSMGGRVIAEAADGENLVETVARAVPDVVVIDYRLPLLDGVEFTRRLRRLTDDRARRVGVVLLAAATTPEMVREARNAGVDEFLCKPFSAGALQRRVGAAVLNRREFIIVESYIGPCRRRFVDPLFDGNERRLGEDLMRVPSNIARLAEAQETA